MKLTDLKEIGCKIHDRFSEMTDNGQVFMNYGGFEVSYLGDKIRIEIRNIWIIPSYKETKKLPFEDFERKIKLHIIQYVFSIIEPIIQPKIQIEIY